MCAKCPFRINAVPPLNAMTDLGANNCHADGETDDSAHLEAGMAAAVAAGKRLYLPAGTYYIGSALDITSALNGLYMYGASRSTSILHMHNGGSPRIISATSGNNITIKSLGFNAPENVTDTTGVHGISVSGTSSGWTLTDLQFDNLSFGIKLGSATAISAFDVNNIDMNSVRIGLYIEDVSSSVFDTIDIGGYGTASGDHNIYMEKNNQNNEFSNLTLANGGNSCLQCYSDDSQPSYNNNFDICSMTTRTGASAHLIYFDNSYNGMSLTNLTLAHRSDTEPGIVWYYGGQNIVIDTFTATNDQVAAPALQIAAGPTWPTSCQLKNGTYATPNDGTWPGVGTVSGVTVTNVVQG